MKIGITFNTQIDYSAQGFVKPEDESAIEIQAAVYNTLKKLKFDAVKIGNFDSLIKAIQRGERWDLVFNIADGIYEISREVLIPCLLETYKIPYLFSDPLTLSLCLNKEIAKRIIRDHGLRTAPFAIIKTEQDIDEVNLPFPLFLKPLLCGRSIGVNQNSLVHTKTELKEQSLFLLETYHHAIIVETYLPGREFTVGILGRGKKIKSLGVMEIIPTANADSHMYSRLNKMHSHEWMQYKFCHDAEAKEAERIALLAWQSLNGRDMGRIDLRSDESHLPHFLEANPIPGLLPERSDIIRLCHFNNISYEDFILTLVTQANSDKTGT